MQKVKLVNEERLYTSERHAEGSARRNGWQSDRVIGEKHDRKAKETLPTARLQHGMEQSWHHRCSVAKSRCYFRLRGFPIGMIVRGYYDAAKKHSYFCGSFAASSWQLRRYVVK